MADIDQLAYKLQPHYTHFNVASRLLFTGHSHQAWPDVALDGLKESFGVSAREVDKKWSIAFEKAEILRDYLREYYDDPDGLYCLSQNTHQLLVAWLSSFDLKNKPKIITTDGEFHSMSRQLSRLKEEGLEVVTLQADSDTLAGQIAEAADKRTAAIMLSRVFYKTGLINTCIREIAQVARNKKIPFLIDDYHGTNVVPISIRKQELEDCYLLIGGYKYLQWGEGNCFLRFPGNCTLRPAVTGWFASFSRLDKPGRNDGVSYDDENQRFASGTYDSASQFRAAKVVAFFRKQGLTPKVLHEQYRAQMGLLRNLFQDQKLDPDVIEPCHNRPLEENGGFMALRSRYARSLRAYLLEQDIITDARGDILRLGPAPYTTTDQIRQCITALAEAVRLM